MGIMQSARNLVGRAIGVSESNDNLVPWPPDADGPRLRAYQEHYEWYRNASGDFDAPIPLLRAVSKLIASRMMGEGVQWTPPAETRVPKDKEQQPSSRTAPEVQRYAATAEHLKHVYDRCNMTQLLLASATGCSYRGDSVLKVRYDANQQRIIVESVLPSLYYPEVDALDGKRVVAAAIAQVLEEGDKKFLWHERHEPGRITNLLWRLDDREATLRYDPTKPVSLTSCQATAELPDMQETGVDAILLVHIANTPDEESGLWGVSDYDGIAGIQGQVNVREEQRGQILAKHSDPILQGPDLAGPSGTVDLEQTKYLVVPPGGIDGAPPIAQYITWDGELTANAEDIRYLTEALATGAGVDVAALVSMLENGAPASGRAIRLLQSRTTTTVNIRALSWAEGLSHVASLITKLATAPGVVLKWKPTSGTIVPLEPEDVTVTFSDGLPSDEIEQTQVETDRLAAGIQSRKRAIMALDGVDEQEAEARVKEIDEEALAQDHTDAAAGTFGGGALGRVPDFLGIGAQSEAVQAQENPLTQQAQGGPVTPAP